MPLPTSSLAATASRLLDLFKLKPQSPAIFKRPRGKKLAKMLGRTGRKYPHSSARQQARYARQIAAGKLRMDGV